MALLWERVTEDENDQWLRLGRYLCAHRCSALSLITSLPPHQVWSEKPDFRGQFKAGNCAANPATVRLGIGTTARNSTLIALSAR